jgi:hypothetical protein
LITARLSALLCLLVAARADVLTQHNDNQRTGANLQETMLTSAEVAAHFGKLWQLPADGQIEAQPLYISGLRTKRRPDGVNAVIFVTMNNTVYAYEADRRPTTSNETLLWARWLGPPQPNFEDARNFDVFYTNDPAWGILSTPVVDKAAATLHLVAWHPDNGGTFRLHALSLLDGSDRLPPRTIEASDGRKRLDPARQKQRTGLLLANGVLYFGFASANENEERAASGWVVAYSAKTLAPLAAWCSTPAGSNGGVWASGQGLAADPEGNIYVATGNGTFEESARGRRDYGGSLVKLRLEKVAGRYTFRVQDFFTPCNQQILSERDLDLGSTGPVLFNRASDIVTAGKQGRLYHLRSARLGGYKAPPAPTLDCVNGAAVLTEIQASRGHIYGSPVYWQGTRHPWLYLWGVGGGLNAYPVVNGHVSEASMKSGDFDLRAEQARFGKLMPKDPCVHNAENDAWMPGGVLSVSSNGAQPGTGIVWALVPANGDANRCRGVKGMLMAFDAGDVTRELWRSQRRDALNSDGPDSYGLLARFVLPTIAGGKVFVATFGDGEPRRFYYQNRRPKTHYPPQSGDQPRHYYLAVYGLK